MSSVSSMYVFEPDARAVKETKSTVGRFSGLVLEVRIPKALT